MKRMLLLLIIGLVYGTTVSKVCFDKAIKVGFSGLAQIGQLPDRCPATYIEASGDLFTRIYRTRESPIITDDSVLVTCCRDKIVGEVVPQYHGRTAGRLPVVPLGQGYEVN